MPLTFTPVFHRILDFKNGVEFLFWPLFYFIPLLNPAHQLTLYIRCPNWFFWSRGLSQGAGKASGQFRLATGYTLGFSWKFSIVIYVGLRMYKLGRKYSLQIFCGLRYFYLEIYVNGRAVKWVRFHTKTAVFVWNLIHCRNCTNNVRLTNPDILRQRL